MFAGANCRNSATEGAVQVDGRCPEVPEPILQGAHHHIAQFQSAPCRVPVGGPDWVPVEPTRSRHYRQCRYFECEDLHEYIMSKDCKKVKDRLS